MLQYLAQCSGHAGKVDQVKNRLIQSNPVLEVPPHLPVIVYQDLTDYGVSLPSFRRLEMPRPTETTTPVDLASTWTLSLTSG